MSDDQENTCLSHVVAKNPHDETKKASSAIKASLALERVNVQEY